VATLKDMESGEQRDTPLADIIPTITRRDRLQG
jgi:hypothetical protein